MPTNQYEQMVLGSILMTPAYLKNAKVTEDDFVNPLNKKIFQIIGRMDADGESIDTSTVASHLEDMNDKLYVFNLYEEVGVSSSFKTYEKYLIEASVKRKLRDFGNLILKHAQNGTPADDILKQIKQHTLKFEEKLEGRHKSIAKQVREFVNETTLDIFATELDKIMGFATKLDKMASRRALQRLEQEGVIVKTGTRGAYRKVDQDLNVIDFAAADPYDTFNISWPFELEKYVKLLPKSIVILAGMWDAGKTAFLLNLVKMNQERHKIRYMSSEMGDAELKLRLDLFADTSTKEWKFEAIDRSSEWEDVILPDDLNIIDYLELSNDFFAVGGHIRKIFDKLKRGVAIIAIQKVPGRTLARGGEFTAEKARLYLTLDPGELTITKGKLWADHNINPKGLTFKFKLWQGHKFVLLGEPFKKLEK